MVAQLALACCLLSRPSTAGCPAIRGDEERRSFNELGPVMLDVDGDGRPDAIKPRVYKATVARKSAGRAKPKVSTVDWLAFDLITSRGRVVRSFFRYNYGEDGVRYWVWLLVPCDFNRDGRVDLMFYSGDDTSDETIILRNTGRTFKVHSRKVSQVE